MPLDINGWVEITRWGVEHRDEEHSWTGLLDLSCIIDTADEVSEVLFGLSKRCVQGYEPPSGSVAKGRGWPLNPGPQVIAERQSIQAHEEKFGPGEVRGITWIAYEEVLSVDWRAMEVLVEQSDWATVFRIIEGLRAEERFASAFFRIVCWAVW